MNPWTWWGRWRGARRELEEETAFHLDRLTEDLIAEGWDPAPARREAVRRFGSPERVHTQWRSASGFALLDEFARNVRFAARGLRRDPLHAATFILTTALTVALGGLAWAVGDATLWRDLPWPEPDRLVRVAMYDAETSARPIGTAVDGATWEAFRSGGPDYPSAVYSGWGSGVNLGADGAAAYVTQQRVGAGYFEVLGIDLFAGREFTPAEDVPNGPALAVLSHGMWTGVFAGDREILGGTILLKGEAHRVVGILPADFRAPSDADVYTPLQPSTTGEGSGTNYSIIARIPPGVGLDDAHRALASVAPAFDWAERPGDQRFGLVPYEDVLVQGAQTPVGVLIGGIGIMLLIGWSNLAGVQLARTLARRAEFHTRRALGAGTGMLARQMIAETTTAGVAGGALGAMVLVLSAPQLESLVQSRFGTWQPLPGPGPLFTVAVLLAACGILVAGVAPVIRVVRSGSHGLRPSSRVRGRVRHAGRRALLVGQLGLATVLVFTAGVLARSYGYLDSLDQGFDPDGLLTVQYSLDDARFAEEDAVSTLFERTLAALETRPEVAAAAVALTLPYERPLNMPVRLPGEDQPLLANMVYVTPGFFELMGIEVRAGRALDGRDGADGAPVVVANQAFVERYLPDRQPIGAILDVGSGLGEVPVLGVVGNVQQSAGWGDESQPVWETPTIYVSAYQLSPEFSSAIHIWFAPSWIIRPATSAAGLAEVVIPTMRSVAPELPVARIATMTDIVGNAFARQRLEATFLLSIAGIALALTGLGLYGLVAQEVAERRGELGVRVALGASPARAVLHIGSAGLAVAGLGLVVGVVLSVGVSRLLESLVWGVGTLDPVTLAGVVAVLGVLAGLASFVPASRIARLDPARVLRED
jgi:predicted permease